MTRPLPKIVLASTSPRRRYILETLGLSFEVLPTHAEEAHPTPTEVEAVTTQNAFAKARRLSDKIRHSGPWVGVGADTLVLCETRVIGKPKNRSEVLDTLGFLSGKKQTVVTGLALVSSDGKERGSITKTDIYFRRLPPAEIEGYADTIEPYDKAGAYAVQGVGSLFIERLDGSYTNAIGFPLETFLKELAAITSTEAFDWFKK